MAIDQGFTILSWFEHLQTKDIPPEHLWADTEGLNSWFDRMKNEDSAATETWKSEDSDDDDEKPQAPGEGRREQKMVENDLARALREA